jgi:hypothetical protein
MKQRSLAYMFVPVVLLVFFMFFYYLLVNIPLMQKKDFLDISLRAWHVQNSLVEFFVHDDYLLKMTETSDSDVLSEKFKEVRKNREAKAKLYASELALIRKMCEENSFCMKSEFGILAINNLDGFADALRNSEYEIAENHYKNETDFLRLFQYDQMNFKGRLDNAYLSRIIALGNAENLIYRKYLMINDYCKNIDEILHSDPLFEKYCLNTIAVDFKEKTCTTEMKLTGEQICKRTKSYIKQISQ